MNRLQTEFQRLYHLPDEAGLIGGQGRARSIVLELARRADWSLLGALWRGVQADLGLPAPAIAVSGTEGLQLWFSLAEPVVNAEAQRFLDGLRQRYLAEVKPTRLRLITTVDATTPLPAVEAAPGQWSAFVAPDLAPLFEDTPWLDIPPGDEGQGQVLAALRSIPKPLFDTAMAQLWPIPAEAHDEAPAAARHAPVPGGHRDARSFLLAVMNAEQVPLALRIEAAKALLTSQSPSSLSPG
jgi:hypothetical protein